jgi:hypothetical protein
MDLGARHWGGSGIDKTAHSSGLFNPFTSAQLAWDLGNGWGFSYLLGTYFGTNGPVAFSSGSLNQRFALSYTGDGWNLTANVIWGSQFEHVTSRPQISPCPVSIAFPSNGCNPDFINVDLTATKRFGRLELGPVGFFSSDLTRQLQVTRSKANSRWEALSATGSIR